MLKIRRPLGRLIFNMGIAIPGKTVFFIETAPRTRQARHSFINDRAVRLCTSLHFSIDGLWYTRSVGFLHQSHLSNNFNSFFLHDLWFWYDFYCAWSFISIPHCIPEQIKTKRISIDVCRKTQLFTWFIFQATFLNTATICIASVGIHIKFLGTGLFFIWNNVKLVLSLFISIR